MLCLAGSMISLLLVVMFVVWMTTVKSSATQVSAAAAAAADADTPTASGSGLAAENDAQTATGDAAEQPAVTAEDEWALTDDESEAEDAAARGAELTVQDDDDEEWERASVNHVSGAAADAALPPARGGNQPLSSYLQARSASREVIEMSTAAPLAGDGADLDQIMQAVESGDAAATAAAVQVYRATAAANMVAGSGSSAAPAHGDGDGDGETMRNLYSHMTQKEQEEDARARARMLPSSFDETDEEVQARQQQAAHLRQLASQETGERKQRLLRSAALLSARNVQRSTIASAKHLRRSLRAQSFDVDATAAAELKSKSTVVSGRRGRRSAVVA